ncbi:MAG: hypothetical protein U0Q12_16950 [Vicinamibacterales bacterium]
MSDGATILLGIIAAATLTMAVVQLGVIVYGIRLARRVDEIVTRVDRDLAPMVKRLTDVSEDAAKVSALALVQVQRVDALFADLSSRVESGVTAVQSALITPAREGLAFVSAVRAVFGALRAARDPAGSNGRGPDDDEQLFIG